MMIGRKAKPESPEEMALVHHVLENSARRNMLILMNEGVLTIPELSAAVGGQMLSYHLHRMELAGLIHLKGDAIQLTESGVAYGGLVREQRERGGAGKT